MKDVERWWIEVWISQFWEWNRRWDYYTKTEESSRSWEMKEKVISENAIYECKNEKFCLWIKAYYIEIR